MGSEKKINMHIIQKIKEVIKNKRKMNPQRSFPVCIIAISRESTLRNQAVELPNVKGK